MKSALIVASFGTTHEDTCERNVQAVESTLADEFPETPILRAFTSGMVRSVLARRKIPVQSVKEAIGTAIDTGCDSLTVLPTHLLYGVEYDSLVETVESLSGAFGTVHIARPLLACVDDFRYVLRTLHTSNPLEPGEALVLMGHGTSHPVNTLYAALNYEAVHMGFDDLFIGTVEAYPSLDDTVRAVTSAGFSRVLVTPLMLVAGDHAINDMASDDSTSWKSTFERAGLKARCLVKGLGEYPQIRELYCEHARTAMEDGVEPR